MTTYALPEHYSQDLMDAVCDWLRANGIEPGTVPMWSDVVVTGNTISYYEMKRDRAGSWELRTTEVIQPMPDSLSEQWRMPLSACPHCGKEIDARIALRLQETNDHG